jgi:hypothetical protein
MRQLWMKKEGADAAITTAVESADDEEPALEQSKESLKARYSRFKLFLFESRAVRWSCIILIIALLSLLIVLLAYTQTRRRHHRITHPSTAFIHTPIQPASYPLAVRSPYLSTWIPGGFVAHLPTASPQFWTGASLNWSIMARVDNTTYSLMGVSGSAGILAATVLKGEFTSTHTYFTLEAGGTNLTLDFLSPVSPSNYLRQSLPFSKCPESTPRHF